MRLVLSEDETLLFWVFLVYMAVQNLSMLLRSAHMEQKDNTTCPLHLHPKSLEELSSLPQPVWPLHELHYGCIDHSLVCRTFKC